MKTNTNTALDVREILNDFRQSTIVIHSIGSIKGADEDLRAFNQSFEDALALIDQYVHQKTIEARIDELKWLFNDVDKKTWWQSETSLAVPVYERVAELQASLNTEGVDNE